MDRRSGTDPDASARFSELAAAPRRCRAPTRCSCPLCGIVALNPVTDATIVARRTYLNPDWPERPFRTGPPRPRTGPGTRHRPRPAIPPRARTHRERDEVVHRADDQRSEDGAYLPRHRPERQAGGDRVVVVALLDEQRHARRQSEAVGESEDAVRREQEEEGRDERELASGCGDRDGVDHRGRQRPGRDQRRSPTSAGIAC